MSKTVSMPSFFPVTCHTNYVGAGSTFVAIKGLKTDGVLFIKEAIEKGAVNIVIEENVALPSDIKALCANKNISIQKVQNSRAALALLSAQAAGFPAQKLVMFGVTGTKGKTTTSTLLAHIFNYAGYNTALLSTAYNLINGVTFKYPLTTAQPDYLHQFLKLCIDNGVTHCVMEIAAQALSLHRIDTIQLDGIIFTNFDREHLEFYDSLESYFEAKKQIFDYAKSLAPILINGDDSWCKNLSNAYYRFGQDKRFAINGQMTHQTIPMQGTIYYNSDTISISQNRLSGFYNFYNCMAAAGMALLYGISEKICQKAINTFAGVPGRFETYALKNSSICVIDSAHNPLSFTAILSSVRLMTDYMIVLFGAGGERDAGRRPMMGAVATEYADVVILTTDNPRSEDPMVIVQDIISGVSSVNQHKIVIELDRAHAIEKAYALSKKGSIILLLGKGNEEYQIIGNQKISFAEKAIIAQWQK
jgi:UDP-N-acetylmuramoyl-L-alanyl-D-glutamate--2,6-diaminopimelate ligase